MFAHQLLNPISLCPPPPPPPPAMKRAHEGETAAATQDPPLTSLDVPAGAADASPAKMLKKSTGTAGEGEWLEKVAARFAYPAPLKNRQSSIHYKHHHTKLARTLSSAAFHKAFAEHRKLSKYVMGEWDLVSAIKSDKAEAAEALSHSAAAGEASSDKEAASTENALVSFESSQDRPIRSVTFIMPPFGIMTSPFPVEETHRVFSYHEDDGFVMGIENKSPTAPYGSKFTNRVLIIAKPNADGDGTVLEISSETHFTGDTGFFKTLIEAGANASIAESFKVFASELEKFMTAGAQ